MKPIASWRGIKYLFWSLIMLAVLVVLAFAVTPRSPMRLVDGVTAPDPANRTTQQEAPEVFEPCRPAHIELAGLWSPAGTIEYFPVDEPHAQVKRRQSAFLDDGLWGLHGTVERTEVDIDVQLRCGDEYCQVCVASVTGRMGYEPSRISVRADLEGNPCVRSHVIAHEQRHADVIRRAQTRTLRRASEVLAWTRRAHPGHVVARSAMRDGEDGARADRNRA